jgi:hypothetical protein
MTAVLLALGVLPPQLAPGWTVRLRDALRSDERSLAEIERMERGYYETLNEMSRRLDPSAVRKPVAAPNDFGPLTLPVSDVREYVLKPSISVPHRGATWTTNPRGMRDRDHPIEKPSGLIRIGLAGDSIGAGWGVEDGQGFEPLWEKSLSRERPVEVWNHAVPGLAPGQRWEHFNREGWESQPDLVVFQGSPADFGWDDRKLRSLLPKGVGWDVASYQEAFQLARIQPGGDEDSYKNALRPHREAILAGVYRTVANDCRSRGVPSVWLLLPRVGKTTPRADRDRLVALARSAGFSKIVDLSDAFDGLDPAPLAIGPDDFHPNAIGHARLADRLDDATRDIIRDLRNQGDDPR